MELENHSDALRDMNKFTTPTVIISGCTYNYVIQMLTPHFFENHLVDTTVVSGPDYLDTTSVKNVYVRNYDKTMKFLQKVQPNYIHVLQDEDATGDMTTTAASSSKKKGVRTTTISSDYDMEIAVNHVKRAPQRRVRQATYRLTTLESATTNGQTTVYVWRTLQQHRSVHYDMMVGSQLH